MISEGFPYFRPNDFSRSSKLEVTFRLIYKLIKNVMELENLESSELLKFFSDGVYTPKKGAVLYLEMRKNQLSKLRRSGEKEDKNETAKNKIPYVIPAGYKKLNLATLLTEEEKALRFSGLDNKEELTKEDRDELLRTNGIQYLNFEFGNDYIMSKLILDYKVRVEVAHAAIQRVMEKLGSEEELAKFVKTKDHFSQQYTDMPDAYIPWLSFSTPYETEVAINEYIVPVAEDFSRKQIKTFISDEDER